MVSPEGRPALTLTPLCSVPLKFDYNEVAVPLTQPACLPAQGVEQQPEGTLCWTAGWGRLKWRGKLANVLQEVDVKLISDEQCMTLETAAIFNPVIFVFESSV